MTPLTHRAQHLLLKADLLLLHACIDRFREAEDDAGSAGVLIDDPERAIDQDSE